MTRNSLNAQRVKLSVVQQQTNFKHNSRPKNFCSAIEKQIVLKSQLTADFWYYILVTKFLWKLMTLLPIPLFCSSSRLTFHWSSFVIMIQIIGYIMASSQMYVTFSNSYRDLVWDFSLYHFFKKCLVKLAELPRSKLKKKKNIKFCLPLEYGHYPFFV